MTVAQKTKNREPHLYQVEKPSNIKTDPDDDDVDSLKAKPKTRQKKESKVRKHCKSHAYTCNIKLQYTSMQSSKNNKLL